MWSTARLDWEDRIVRGQSLMPDLPDLDQAEAARARAIFDKLHLPDVPGQPALAEAGADWFREIVGALMGCVIDGERQLREMFLLAPKKSSKTSYGAALMMTALLMNERPRAEFLLVAPTIMVAELAFNQAVGMIQADPEHFLQRRFHVIEHKKIIRDRRTNARLMIKTFDAKVLTGVKPTGVLLDELHEIARDASAARVLGQIRGGLIPNPEAFLFIISTQSDRPPVGVFESELLKARRVRDGKQKSSLLPILYEFPKAMVKSDAWRDPANWWMVTPNRGKSITVERLIPDWEDAQQSGDDEIRRWASQHLNLQIGLALSNDRWAGADFWEKATDEKLSLRRIIKVCDALAVGIDGGGADDLLAMGVVGRLASDHRVWLIWARAWCHKKVLENRKAAASELESLAATGDLTIVERLGPDVEELAETCHQIDLSGKLVGVGLDPMTVGGIVDALAEHGIEGEKRVIGIPQGWRITGAIKTLERKLDDGTARHCGQPLMAYAVGNAKIEPRGNAVLITKQVSGTAKIDPLMAVLDAVAIMSKNPEGPMDISAFLRNPVMST